VTVGRQLGDPPKRPLAIRAVTCACGVLLVLAVSDRVRAQGGTGPSTQVWANFTPGRTIGERWYMELDVEPKWQVTSGEEWRNLDLTPLVEAYPFSWLDLESEATVGRTHQRDGLDTFEVTPRVGARFNLFAKFARAVRAREDRLPLTRLAISTLVRLEWRNFFYSDATPDRHEWRFRVRLEGKVALNHPRLTDDRTFYGIGDIEYYAPMGDDVEERYVNKVRVRLGAGYRSSKSTRLEVLYIRDWNRKAPGASAAEDTQAIDVRLKRFF